MLSSRSCHLNLLSNQDAKFSCETKLPTMVVFHEKTVTQESPSFTVVFTPWYKQTGLKSNSCCLHLIIFCWPSTGIPVHLGEMREKQDFHTVLLKIQSVADWLHQTFVHSSDLISKWKNTQLFIWNQKPHTTYVLIAAVKVTERNDDPCGTDLYLQEIIRGYWNHSE